MKLELGQVLVADPELLAQQEEQLAAENPEIESERDDEMNTDDKHCIECGDQPAELFCNACEEQFCLVCFGYLHRTGKRKDHPIKKIDYEPPETNENGEVRSNDVPVAPDNASVSNMDIDEQSSPPSGVATPNTTLSMAPEPIIIVSQGSASFGSWLLQRTKYIPLRLTQGERKLLRLLEAALNVSEYTDKVDVLAYSSKAKRIIGQLQEICSILAGLVVATDMKLGQEMFEDKDFARNAKWFKKIFEIGRRYKIMNPQKMRDSFGKLMYMVMDSRLPEVQEVMEFDLFMPILTVYSFLESKDCLALLEDNLIVQATAEIYPDHKKRSQIQAEIKQKEKAIETLARRYYKPGVIAQDDIRQCLYSIGDNHSYLRSNKNPVEKIQKYLQQYFHPEKIEAEYTLAISYGRGGARLSHNHEKQYYYVNQSLTLWSIIMNDMFMLWSLADQDLLSTNGRYRLLDTGQGLNRVQSCPAVSRAMQGVISTAQKRAKSWIGSSVVHLGDRSVPNAWFFLDKYLQVPQILNPLESVIGNIDVVARDPFVYDWIKSQFGSVEDLKKTILCDFFQHAFDGSGADNFQEAGSCIDGRLTSAWNWANSISKKPYLKIFLLCGFTGFNGTEGF
ncbi:hypothetical protein POJ06DRAFT_32116 [Lipomyces tetrasporus]|uniref:B box-type domain-containing protein n=1 Tax=Lipomyces tetrasporus TaxID=54092 RepID=A0AAD7QM14_9ASCO|nr:uncharacterized protein POJ06DRAFT_32116 [Lipomyces tetrasporus]KAJ8097455.1 hypothetical protein POJ06DRAFT_32116 [Lipomyces tetrasporus]